MSGQICGNCTKGIVLIVFKLQYPIGSVETVVMLGKHLLVASAERIKNNNIN